MYKKIVVAVDLNETDVARPALSAAIELARLTNGELRLVHVRHPIPSSPLAMFGGGVLSDQKDHYDSELAKLSASLPFPADQVSVANLSGAVYDEILSEARRWGADLIVVAAHQPSMATYLIGSNASKIVRHAHCTTLVVRSDKTASLGV